MQNARLDEAQAGIKTAGRNINKHRYAGDTIIMAESEEELNSLLMKVKEESEKVGLWAISNPKRWRSESAALNMSANLENSPLATGLEEIRLRNIKIIG